MCRLKNLDLLCSRFVFIFYVVCFVGCGLLKIIVMIIIIKVAELLNIVKIISPI
ncbi:hypothetical protein BSPA14S_K0003 (plasmid) [Borreliella spielmanii A14S]|uniref:Uncharacterized protein n=1 Tax=Borreliella spielmanii A14S TaxID=498742 RepID=C0RBR3_9SPIR|nr:hypothetical protein BSPA14S_K0003 [Borreliella spielmanii A14S]